MSLFPAYSNVASTSKNDDETSTTASKTGWYIDSPKKFHHLYHFFFY